MAKKIMRYAVIWDEHYAEGDGFYLFSNKKEAIEKYKDALTWHNSDGDEIILAKIIRHSTKHYKNGAMLIKENRII